jgi:putative holliday junction resolvase
MNSLMRIMALDLGTKTIGIAVTDELMLTAQGLETWRRKGPKQDLNELKRLATEYGVTRFVLGFPINMNGTLGPKAQFTKEFGAQLFEATQIPVEYQDERLTTSEAQRLLISGDVSREKRKQVVDQLAASIILQGWMMKNAKPISAESDE